MADKLLDDIINSAETLTDQSNFAVEDQILAPLLEEIDLIQNEHMRLFVRAVLLRVGDFWDTAASLVPDTHPPDEYGKGGLVLHTKRVVRAIWLLSESQHRTEEELDILIAAGLLHDVMKMTDLPDGTLTMDAMHPYTVDALVRRVMLYDESHADHSQRSSTLYIQNNPTVLAQILRIIRCHEGLYSMIPETVPLTSLEWIMHLANQVACHLHHIVDGPAILDWRWDNTTKRRNARTK